MTRPLEDLIAFLPSIRGVLFDIDDTFSTHGRITASAYGALEALSERGLIMVPVTGRPAGWCDLIARMWPVDGVIGENGALYYRLSDTGMTRVYSRSDAERDHDRVEIARLARSIPQQVPGTQVAADQPFRSVDLAIDFAEDVTPADEASIARIVTLFEAAGARAKVSSIHVNGWFGDHDKLSMTLRLFDEQLGVDAETLRERFIYVGDSPNDEPMFEFFTHSIGVANVRRFIDGLRHPPRYVTWNEAGDGFAEIGDLIRTHGPPPAGC